MPRRLTTILAADVVGYSRLMGEDEAGTLTALKSLRRTLIKPKELQYGGRTVKLMGDGALMEFASVVDAVTFAVEIQWAMAERNAEMPEGRRIVYRIGLNIGDIIVEGDDIYGDGVNVAARLEALCEPGGICVSRNVFDQVKGKLDLTYQHLGEKEVKNIAEPVTVYRVMLDQKAAALVTPVVHTAAPIRRARGAVVATGLILGSLAVAGVIWWRPWASDIEPASVKQTALPLPTAFVASMAQTTLQDPDLSGLSDKDKDFITELCHRLNEDPQVRNDPELKALSDYHTCLSVQLSNLKSAPSEPDLSGLSDMERDIIERYCEDASQSIVHGISGFRKCLRDELRNSKTDPFKVDLSNLSDADRQKLSSTCWDAGFYGGITWFRKCASEALVEWKSTPSQP